MHDCLQPGISDMNADLDEIPEAPHERQTFFHFEENNYVIKFYETAHERPTKNCHPDTNNYMIMSSRAKIQMSAFDKHWFEMTSWRFKQKLDNEDATYA